MNVKVVQGDILSFEGDAIVNPANSFLRHGGGLAALIAKRASENPSDPFRPNDFESDCLRHPNIPVGGAGWTSAGALPYKGIVHAVGPIWGGGTFLERELLALAHAHAIRVADKQGCASLAIPAISCGIFGFPVEEAAEIAIMSAQVQSNVFDVAVTFYLFEDAHYEAYQAALKGSW